MILAIAADALQIFVFPLFAEGALSPAGCRTCARSRFGSVLDACGRQRLPQMEANGNHRIRTSSWALGGRRRVQIFLGMGRSAHRGENVNE